MTDAELRKLNLPEVPDDLCERWSELFEEDFKKKEEATNGREPLP